MERRRLLQCVGLLLLIGAPLSIRGLQTTSYGGWPAMGFATALFLVAGRPWRVHVLVGETVLMGVALTLSYHVSLWLGVLGALTVSLPALLSWHLLTRGGRDQLLLQALDRGRYHLATLAGALLCGVFAAGTVTAAGMDLRDISLSALMSTLAALTAQLVVLPLALRGGTERPSASQLELTAQRVTMLVVMVTVFVPRSSLSLAFLVFPVLAWAATRARAREALVQLFLVSVTAYAFTFAGRGPMSAPTESLPGVLAPALLYLFVAAVCYLIVPLTLTVEQLFSMTAQATRAAVTVERLIESATHTVFIATDGNGRITHYNAGAQRTLGYAESEVLGQSPAMFHSTEEIARQAEHYGVAPHHTAVALAQAASGRRRDWFFRHQDGSERMISLSLSRVTDSSGEVVGYIGAGEDITERMRAQAALSTALEREHAAVVRLQEVDHVKQELVSNVSHELRTPITSISGYAELLADNALGELTSSQSDAVQRIERNTTRLGLLVEDLLTMSRAESGQLLLERSPLDLNEVARDAFEMLDEMVRTRDLDVRLDLDDQPLTMLGDRHALERVALNLLNNAIKFTPDGGSAVLGVRRTADGAALVVSDTGLGIPEQDQEQLFSRFFRSSAATEHAIQGTGLGLSIVHAIVTQHGGTVTVDSAQGRGTRVTALFPDDDDRD